jgi:hypothetical protein
METVRRILLEAEEEYPSDPDLTLGVWAARVQETIAVAADLTLAGAEDGHFPEEGGAALDVIAVFAEMCAESIRAAARVVPAPPMVRDQKEALLAGLGSEERALESRLDWNGLQGVLVRCQAAMEPISGGLRDGDLPMNREVDPSGLAYDALVTVAKLGYGVVYAFCTEVRPEEGSGVAGAGEFSGAPSTRSVGTPGASVRRTERRLHVKAGLRILVAVALLAAAIAVLAKGSSSSAILLAIGGGFSLLSARRVVGRARAFGLGAIAEEEVGRLLDQLRVPWLVEHDVQKGGGGNIDHILHSPAGIYLIDTKRSQYRDKDFDQARRHVAWAYRRFGDNSHIIPVICVQRSDLGPELIQGVWIVGAGQLQSFLLSGPR